MDYDRRQYFRDHTDPTVNGLTIIETDESEGYRIAEKWQRGESAESPQASDVWVTYWIPASKLDQRAAEGKVEPVGTLSDEQFEQVCQLSDERALRGEGESVPA